jgi:hypothetical protein
LSGGPFVHGSACVGRHRWSDPYAAVGPARPAPITAIITNTRPFKSAVDLPPTDSEGIAPVQGLQAEDNLPSHRDEVCPGNADCSPLLSDRIASSRSTHHAETLVLAPFHPRLRSRSVWPLAGH